MKTIDGSWLRKDFKQKYFLYCQDCKTEKLVKTFGSLDNKSYIAPKIIKIEEL